MGTLDARMLSTFKGFGVLIQLKGDHILARVSILFSKGKFLLDCCAMVMSFRQTRLRISPNPFGVWPLFRLAACFMSVGYLIDGPMAVNHDDRILSDICVPFGSTPRSTVGSSRCQCSEVH